jgi:hypothetical protein
MTKIQVKKPSLILHKPSGKWVGLYGWTLELTDALLAAPLLTTENTGAKRGDDFHVNFFTAAVAKYGRRNLALVQYKL